MIKVKLIDFAGGDLSVVNAARVSFNKEVETIDGKDMNLINYLAKHRHDTPFRHNFIQLRCEVPIFLARQLFKHQAGLTVNEESRRYIEYTPDLYFPIEWRKRPAKSIKQGSGEVHERSDMWKTYYRNYLEDAIILYEDMLADGVAPEMARMVLPQSMMVNFIWSGNLLAFHHVYKLRSGEGAQEEAKIFADKLKEEIELAFPVSWSALENR